MSIDKEYILNKIKDNYNVIGKSEFYKIYKVFDKPCNTFPDNEASCCTQSTSLWAESSKVIDLLKDLYSNLFRIYASIPYTNNDYFEFDISEYKKMCSISLKYWLYDQIINRNLNETDINAIYTGWKTYLKDKIPKRSTEFCIFQKLKKNEINMIKNIYALYTIFYDNTNILETCTNDKCKYIDYFRKGLDDFINSIKKCSSDSANNEYCNEFNEFIELCKEDNENAGISIYDEKTKSNAETAKKYFLFSEKYKEEQLYIYIKNEKLLNFIKTSDFLSNKSTTIAATSVVGSAIALSSIFYYFFKFTPFGSSLRTGKGENIVNIDQEAHDALLYTSDAEQTPFQSRKYNVAYHNFSDT